MNKGIDEMKKEKTIKIIKLPKKRITKMKIFSSKEEDKRFKENNLKYKK